jgi:hypothetical protein
MGLLPRKITVKPVPPLTLRRWWHGEYAGWTQTLAMIQASKEQFLDSFLHSPKVILAAGDRLSAVEFGILWNQAEAKIRGLTKNYYLTEHR